MSSKPPKINGVSIEDDMDDDFDDLLDKFDHGPTTQPTKSLFPKLNDNKENSEVDLESLKDISDEFARDLAEGMEALLAGMKDEDGGEFKKHLEALAQGQGHSSDDVNDLLAALNHQENGSHTSTTNAEAPGTGEPEIELKNFQDAIKETMDKLKQSEDSAKASAGPSGPGSEDERLASLLEKMMAGQGGLTDENQLQTMLQGFMEELMSKEIMYEPLKDMDRLYPNWISTNRSRLSPDELQRYQAQSEIVADVVKKFEHPSWDAEEKTGGEKFASRQREVIDLLTKMQDCGSPPKEIIGEMPPGMLGPDGLPNPEQCSIS